MGEFENKISYVLHLSKTRFLSASPFSEGGSPIPSPLGDALKRRFFCFGAKNEY